MSEPRSLAFVDSITYVELRDLPHGGPFWDHEGASAMNGRSGSPWACLVRRTASA